LFAARVYFSLSTNLETCGFFFAKQPNISKQTYRNRNSDSYTAANISKHRGKKSQEVQKKKYQDTEATKNVDSGAGWLGILSAKHRKRTLILNGAGTRSFPPSFTLDCFDPSRQEG